jgi:hypothetical protein
MLRDWHLLNLLPPSNNTGLEATPPVAPEAMAQTWQKPCFTHRWQLRALGCGSGWEVARHSSPSSRLHRASQPQRAASGWGTPYAALSVKGRRAGRW